ncbi:MAG: hypothetical protein CFH44_00192 [Proteobacteria bacterium]|nr:MAG: hypothetical protein CFH44_00192 [Pseudomonadota bacterium]
MNKYILTLFALIISAQANAFSFSDLTDLFSSDEPEQKSITMPSAEELKIKSAATSITSFFDSNSVMNITDDQKAMLKTSYDYLKQQEITDPKLKEVADKAIDLIDTSGIFNDKVGFVDSLIR